MRISKMIEGESITYVHTPDSVTSIGDDAFFNCNNLSATYKGVTYTSYEQDGLYYMPPEFYAAINGQ